MIDVVFRVVCITIISVNIQHIEINNTDRLSVLEGARASTGLCVDVSMQWTHDINESN